MTYVVPEIAYTNINGYLLRASFAICLELGHLVYRDLYRGHGLVSETGMLLAALSTAKVPERSGAKTPGRE